MDLEQIHKNYPRQWEKKPCYRISSSPKGHTVTFQGSYDRSTYTPMAQQYRDFLIFQ